MRLRMSPCLQAPTCCSNSLLALWKGMSRPWGDENLCAMCLSHPSCGLSESLVCHDWVGWEEATACCLQAGEEPAVPSLSEAEEAYTALPGGSADISHLQAERQRSRMRLSSVARLEQVSSQHPDSLACIDISPYSGCRRKVPDLLPLLLQDQRLPASKETLFSGLIGVPSAVLHASSRMSSQSTASSAAQHLCSAAH